MNNDELKAPSAFDKGLEDLDQELKDDIAKALAEFTKRVETTLQELRKGFEERGN